MMDDLHFLNYTPENWFWIVAGDSARAWSSADRQFVTDPARWDGRPVTHIASLAELNDVLRSAGLPVATPALSDCDAAIKAHIDAVARERNFDDGADATTFANSTQAEWSAEALAFIGWRDSVWLAFDAAKANLPSSPEAFIASLPPIEWPAAA